jgi:DNA/RNA endonuclease YhcR with UshA esterase domain
MTGSVAMGTKSGVVSVIVATVFILTVVALPLNVSAEEIRIDSIGKTHIGKEVTVSGIIIAISSNIEPSTSEEEGIQTFEPGNLGVLTIDDGTGTIFVSCDLQLLEEFYDGQRVMVTGIYSGKVDDKGMIYASTVSADLALGYTDVTVKELNDCPGYYYAHSVRIQGNVTHLELTSGKTELEIDDDSGTMDVEYRAELENITIDDAVIVEGKFYHNKIYAFSKACLSTS